MNYYILVHKNHKPKLVQAATMTEATAGAKKDLIACYKVESFTHDGLTHYYINDGRGAK